MIRQNIIKQLALKFPFLGNSHIRDQWVIKQLSNISPGKKILDAGAGECVYKKYCGELEYTSQDFNQYDGKGNLEGLQTTTWNDSQIDIVSDITNIPRESKSFDVILCTEVIEHIPYPDKAIIEFSRLIKDNGELILTAPFCSQTHFAPYHYCSGFNVYWYQKVLNDNNFEIITYERYGNYFDYLIQEVLRSPIVFKKYSNVGIFVFILLIPIVIVFSLLLYLFSLLTKESDKQLFFGSLVKARKII